jgi:hypothetical protein
LGFTLHWGNTSCTLPTRKKTVTVICFMPGRERPASVLRNFFFDQNSPHAGGMACALKGSLN